MDPSAVREEQLVRMARTVRWARQSEFWSRRLPGADPAWENWAEIPNVTKRELIENQAEHAPYGSSLCVATDQIARVFATSGTTGHQLLRALSQADWANAIDRAADNIRDLAPGTPVMVLSPADLFGASIVQAAIQSTNLVPVMAGRWSTEARARFIASARPAAVVGVPSYLLHLADIAGEHGLDLSEAGVARIVSFGEPGGSQPAVRARLRERYGEIQIIDGYGMTEAGPLGRGCPAGAGLHFDEGDFVVECLDPSTQTPVADGEMGELVITTLRVEAHPLIRYRTGDLVRLAAPGVCACGSWARRTEGSLQGRTDEMIWYRGVNLFPSTIGALIARENALTESFELVVDGRRALLSLQLRVESASPLTDSEAKRLAADIAGKLRDALGIEVPTIVESPGSIHVELSNGKFRRVRRLE